MQEKFTFFASSTSVFSQWYDKAPFTRNGIKFRTAEHSMMYFKGIVFGAPHNLISAILDAPHPREAKALGRKIPNFNEEVWDPLAPDLVAAGSYAKFEQNPHALEHLIRTNGTTLVEAAPWDKIWGIGLSADDPRAFQRITWLGLNKLGETLTRVGRTFNAVERMRGLECFPDDRQAQA